MRRIVINLASPFHFLVVGALTLSLMVVGLAACGSATSGGTTSAPVTLRVFAAASLTAAFGDIGKAFEQGHANVTVTNNFGGSDTLAAQITQGAPADVFASANAAQMNTVVKGAQVDGAAVKTFAHNRLVVIYPSANPAHLQTLQDLANPGVKVDLATSTVPVGGYALDFLSKASADPSFGSAFKANVLKNVVSYETDVKVVLTKVSLGEADAGIVYTTDAATETGTVGTITIPDALNDVALYLIAPVKASANATIAAQYVEYVTSAAGQATLTNYGFIAGSTGAQYAPPSS